MPILWRYLCKEYLKVSFLSILAFICVLLVTRLKQIASFASLSSDFVSIVLFILYQIPYILPIAISISCLISSIILFQRMSTTHEMTAIRASGISLKQLLAPLLLLAIVFSMVDFFIVSELTPRCRYKSKELFYKNTSMNPLVLLQRRQKMSNIKDSYVEITAENKDLLAKDLLIITPNKSNQKLCMFTAKNLMVDKDNLIGNNISLITYVNSNKENNFDNLMIENQLTMATKANAITQFIKAKEWDMNITSMPIKMLIIHTKQNDKRQVKRAQIEIVRRFGFALSSFSFTFIGTSFGITINRITSRKNILTISLLTLLVLFSFTLGKALKKYPILCFIAYILPQVLAIIITTYKLRKISRGKE